MDRSNGQSTAGATNPTTAPPATPAGLPAVGADGRHPEPGTTTMTKLSDTQSAILKAASQHALGLARAPAALPAGARIAVFRSMLGNNLLTETLAPLEYVALGWRQDAEGTWIAARITEEGLRAIGIAPDEGDGVAGEPDCSGITALVQDIVPTAPLGESLAASRPSPPSPSGEVAKGPQRPPVSQREPIGRAAGLRIAATAVTTAWDAPAREGLDEAVASLIAVLAAAPASRRNTGAPRYPRTGTKQEAVLALLRRSDGATIADIIDATAWQQHTVRGFLASLNKRGHQVEVLERIRQVGPNKAGSRGSYSIYCIGGAA